MAAIEAALAAAGFSTFLPQRDGMEFVRLAPLLRERGLSREQAADALRRAIFSLDVYQVRQADGIVVNLHGRVPDEGAVVEAAIAWTLDKVVIFYKDDPRGLLEGMDNPLVSGLGDFRVVDRIETLPAAFHEAFSAGASEHTATLALGRSIAARRAASKDLHDVADLIIAHLDEPPFTTAVD